MFNVFKTGNLNDPNFPAVADLVGTCTYFGEAMLLIGAEVEAADDGQLFRFIAKSDEIPYNSIDLTVIKPTPR